MIGEFNQMAADLDRQIAIGRTAPGSLTPIITPIRHLPRRPSKARNLHASAADLEAKLASARELLAEAVEELKKFELLEERDAERIKLEQARAAELVWGQTCTTGLRADE